MSQDKDQVKKILQQIHGMAKSLETEYGLQISASGEIVSTMEKPTNEAMGAGKSIRWPGRCPDGLVGFNVEAAAARGVAPPPQDQRPHPAQYDSAGHLCVTSQSAERSLNKSKSGGVVTQSRALVAACAQLVRQMGTIGKANLSCDDVNVTFDAGDARAAFCATLHDDKGKNSCRLAGETCVPAVKSAAPIRDAVASGRIPVQ